MKAKTIVDMLFNFDLPIGRLFGSKSMYREANPDNLVLFNANIITKSHGKIWWGDLDLTKDFKKLKSVAKEIGEPLYVLYEMDARFGAENDNVEDLIKKAVWNTDEDYYPDINNYLLRKKENGN